MGLIAIPNVFAPRTTAKASEVNANFSEIASKFNASAVLTDVAKTITVTHTFTPAQTFSGGASFGAAITVTGTITLSGAPALQYGTGTLTLVGGTTGTTIANNANSAPNIAVSDNGAVGFRNTITVSAGGIAVTGNSTITGTLGGITGLTVGGAGITVSAGGVNISAGGLTVTGGIAGTLSTAAQPNITSVGVLASTHLTSPVVDSGGLTITAGDLSLSAGKVRASANGMFGAWDGVGDAGSVVVCNNTTTTATAGAQSLPASPAGFLSWRLGAASIKVPYYNA